MAIEKRRQYNSYDEYVAHQVEKTASPRLRIRLKSRFEGKVKKFLARFSPLKEDGLIKDGNRALCLGARMGEEVVALNELGLEAIGVDLVPNPPLVVKGDFNDLDFDEESFDVIYTNSFDHAWAKDDFFESTHRVLKQGGIFVFDVFPVEENFARCEVIFVEKADDVAKDLNDSGKFKLLKKDAKLPHLQRGRHREVQLVFERT